MAGSGNKKQRKKERQAKTAKEKEKALKKKAAKKGEAMAEEVVEIEKADALTIDARAEKERQVKTAAKIATATKVVKGAAVAMETARMAYESPIDLVSKGATKSLKNYIANTTTEGLGRLFGYKKEEMVSDTLNAIAGGTEIIEDTKYSKNPIRKEALLTATSARDTLVRQFIAPGLKAAVYANAVPVVGPLAFPLAETVTPAMVAGAEFFIAGVEYGLVLGVQSVKEKFQAEQQNEAAPSNAIIYQRQLEGLRKSVGKPGIPEAKRKKMAESLKATEALIKEHFKKPGKR